MFARKKNAICLPKIKKEYCTLKTRRIVRERARDPKRPSTRSSYSGCTVVSLETDISQDYRDTVSKCARLSISRLSVCQDYRLSDSKGNPWILVNSFRAFGIVDSNNIRSQSNCRVAERDSPPGNSNPSKYFNGTRESDTDAAALYIFYRPTFFFGTPHLATAHIPDAPFLKTNKPYLPQKLSASGV